MSPPDPTLRRAKLAAISAALESFLLEVRAGQLSEPTLLRETSLAILNALRTLDGARRREGMRKWHQREARKGSDAS